MLAAKFLHFPDGRFHPRDLPFPVLVHIRQPVVNGIRKSALLPFQICPLFRLHLGLDAAPQSIHRFFHPGLGVLCGGVPVSLLTPVHPLRHPLGSFPVSHGFVRQLHHRQHLVHQIVRDVLALLRVVVQLRQLSRQLADLAPGVVLVPALPHLFQPLRVLCPFQRHFLPRAAAFRFPPYRRLLLHLPLLSAKLLPQLCLGFCVVLLRFCGRIRIGLCHPLPVSCPLLCRL